MTLARVLVACLLCGIWSTGYTQFGVWSLPRFRTARNRAPSSEVLNSLHQEPFDNAESRKTSLLYSRLLDDPEPEHAPYQEEAKQHSSSPYRTVSENSKENPASKDQKLTSDRETPVSSDSAYTALKAASETAQDIWRMLNPSRLDVPTADVQQTVETEPRENDPVSIDEALNSIRRIIGILSRTHNALLDKKLANVPLVQRLWLKFLHSYGNPLAGFSESDQGDQVRPKLSNFADSARDFANILGNSDVKENINTVTRLFAREMLLSISALKEITRNAVHSGQLMTSDIRAYTAEMISNLSVVSKKWSKRIGMLADAAKPIAKNVASNDYVQKILRDMEDMISEFQEEVWRTRTEWAYKQSATLSWAIEGLHTVKHLGRQGLDRFSESMHTHVSEAKYILMERIERSKAHAADLRQHAAERVNHFIERLVFWIEVNQRMVCDVITASRSFLTKVWRVISFVVVIVFFRILLNFVPTEVSVGDLVTSAFSRTLSSIGINSKYQNVRPASERGTGRPQTFSSTKSVSSESKPITQDPNHEEDVAPNSCKPSQERRTVSPNRDINMNSTTQRKGQRTSPKTGQRNTTGSAGRPLRLSNFDYQTSQSELEHQGDGQPIRIGDHEVQLVFDETPRVANIEGSTTIGSGRKRESTTVRDTSDRLHPRRAQNQTALERRTEHDDGDNTSGTASGFESANSRQVRSSDRRTSARGKYPR